MEIRNEKGFVKFDIEDDVLIINNLFANEKRKGFGTSLLKEIESYAWDNNIKRIELFAYPQDDSISEDDLLEFYRNNGYEDNEIRGDFSKDL